jgi:hypothetical protein
MFYICFNNIAQRNIRKEIFRRFRVDISELKQVTFLTTRTSTGSKVDVFHQSQSLTQSSDVTHAVRVVKNVTCLSSLLSYINTALSQSAFRIYKCYIINTNIK